MVNPLIEYVKTRLTTQQASEAAEASNATARQTNALTASKSDRGLIMGALELAWASDPEAQRHGYALLDGLSKMTGLSSGVAVLVQSLTRPQIESTLSAGRSAEDIQGVEAEYVFDLDLPQDDEGAGEP